MGQKASKKWTAEAVSQPTVPKPDRLLAVWAARTLARSSRVRVVVLESAPLLGG